MKLSPAMLDVIRLMQEGWELLYQFNGKHIVAKEDKLKRVATGTYFALRRRNLLVRSEEKVRLVNGNWWKLTNAGKAVQTEARKCDSPPT